MRELKTNELNEVSGAGFITDAAAALGQSFGNFLEAVGVKGATAAGTNIGGSFGQFIETGVNIFTSIFGGLFGKK